MRTIGMGFVALGVLWGTWAGADYVMTGADPANSGVSPTVLAPPFSLAWSFQARQYDGNPCPVLIAEGKALVSARNVIYCLDAETGAEIWRYPSKGFMSSTIRTSPVLAEGQIIVPLLSGELTAFSLEDGSQVWTFEGKKPIRSAAAVADGVVYFGNSANELYAIDAASGASRWAEPFKVGEDVMSRPVVAGGRVFVCSRDNYAYGADAKSGKGLWRARVPYPTREMSPAVSGQMLIVPTEHAILGMLAASGGVRWQYLVKSTVTTSVAAGERYVYFGTKEGEFYCIDVRGQEVWKKDLGERIYSQPAISGDTVFVGTIGGTVYGFDAGKGDLQWRYQFQPIKASESKWIAQGCYAPFSIDGDNLFVLTDLGWVYRFQKTIPDRGEPDISTLRPKPDKEIPGRPPVEFSAFIRDEGSGVDASSIRMTLDGEQVEHEYDEITGKLTYKTPVTQPVVPLSDGLHSVVVTACDWAGNKAERHWDVRVNNRLAGP
jgi:outer membrane protein assembly factor BamB